jgi:hypothetical protein
MFSGGEKNFSFTISTPLFDHPGVSLKPHDTKPSL